MVIAKLHFQEIERQSRLGRSTAFVGFTAAIGGLTATQDILSWNYTGIA